MTRVEAFDRYQAEGGVHGYDCMTALPESYYLNVLIPFIRRIYEENLNECMAADIAAGRGLAAGYMRGLGIRTVSEDLSIEGLRLGEEERVQSFADSLPFKDGSLGAIHTKDAMVHLPDKELFFQEAYRVLQKNGLLMVVSQQFRGKGIFVGKENRYIPFQDERELLHLYEKLEGIYETEEISPPYYTSDFGNLFNGAIWSGFTNIWTDIWKPMYGERDWGDTETETRMVLIFRKQGE